MRNATRYLIREKQTCGFLQPDLPAFFLRRQALEFDFFGIPRVAEFLRPFFGLFPRTRLGAYSAVLAGALTL